MRRALNVLAAQRGQFFPWAAVCYGTGIAVYFALPVEPAISLLVFFSVVTLGGVVLALWLRNEASPLIWAVALCLAGLCVAAAHAHLRSAPVLSFRYYGPVEGRIVHVDRSQSDKLRLTLDQVRLSGVSSARTPARVRVSLHGEQGYVEPVPGTVVMMTAHLSPPQGPAEPGGFDFRRKAWFERLGAVGYTRIPVLRLMPPEPGLPQALDRIRSRLSEYVAQRVDARAEGIATAIITGDRSRLDRDVVQYLRDANLAHLLAISGLHMGLLAGFVFAVLRYGLALFPVIALRWPTKKIAAVGAMLVALAYLAMAGGGVATLRACVMAYVVLTAVLLDRRALTLHAVALAGFIVLTLHPHSLIGPGFQMSFAATIALVVVFRDMRDMTLLKGPRWSHIVIALVLSSLVAGLATAPFAAAHFNRIAHFGLLANLLSVPVMGLVVMPAAVLGIVLTPFGIEGVAFWAMEQGILWIMQIARFVAGLNGAVGHIMAPPDAVIPLVAVAALFIALWQGRARMLGCLGLLAAVAFWNTATRPQVLIADSGRLAGVLTADGRALNKKRGDGFVARLWLENDGDGADQWQAAQRGGEEQFALTVGAQTLHVINGQDEAERIRALCSPQTIIVTALEISDTTGCTIWDIVHLRQSGAIAIDTNGQITTAAQRAGQRLWTQ